jgi:hypothetical protein
MYSSCHQIVCDSDLSIAPGAASDNFRVVDDPGATSRGSLMRGQKGSLLRMGAFRARRQIVIRDAQPATLNSDRRRGRGLFVRNKDAGLSRPPSAISADHDG